MKLIKALFLCMCAVFTTAVLAEAKEWRGIVPLHSTREDVERLLGQSNEKCQCGYSLNDVNVSVVYANGKPCGEEESNDWRVGGWRVPRDTVIQLTVYYKPRRRLSELKIDVSRYKKISNEELPGVFYYVDADEGVRIEVVGDTVGGITYFPAAKDSNLSCPSSTAKQQCKEQ